MHKIDQELNMMIRGEFDDAWKVCQMLEEEDPYDLRHRFNRGWFLIQQGKFQEGFQSLEAGRYLNVYGSPQLPTAKTIWNGEDLNGKVVIINLEAGYGDQIISARFATEVHKLGGKAILCCHPDLHSIFSRIPGVARCITLNDVRYTRHDYWIPGFSCSWLFGHEVHNMPNQPYLTPLQESVKVWKNITNVDEKIKVGIRWSGNPKFEHQQFRIFPTEPMFSLSRYKDIRLFSFQRDHDLRELPEDIIDLQHLLISWEDTLAALANMDLVITSCTSIAHASAAMGKDTWVIVPILPYHIWTYGAPHTTTSPWYQDNTRIFRQSKFSNWDQTFDDLKRAFVERYNLED